MVHQNECFVNMPDDDPILVAALRRAGMVFDPMSEAGWVWPQLDVDEMPSDMGERVKQRTLETVREELVAA